MITEELGQTATGTLTDYNVAWVSEDRIVQTFGDQFNGRDDALTDSQNASDESHDT